MGYYQNDVDPSWWHPTIFISIATMFWSFLSATVLTALRGVYRLTIRSQSSRG